MGNTRLDLTGQIINGVEVVSFHSMIRGRTHWNCICRCEKELISAGSYIKSGKAGCGCRRGRGHTHGMTNTKFFKLWTRIITRCYNKSCFGYYRYGGRGIVVCDRWKTSFQNFMDDMYEEYLEVKKTIPNLQIDRIENDGNYCPENCRFVSPKENANNRSTESVRVLNNFQAVEVMDMYFSGNYSYKQISDIMLVSKSTIGSLVSGKMYRNLFC